MRRASRHFPPSPLPSGNLAFLVPQPSDPYPPSSPKQPFLPRGSIRRTATMGSLVRRGRTADAECTIAISGVIGPVALVHTAIRRNPVAAHVAATAPTGTRLPTSTLRLHRPRRRRARPRRYALGWSLGCCHAGLRMPKNQNAPNTSTRRKYCPYQLDSTFSAGGRQLVF